METTEKNNFKEKSFEWHPHGSVAGRILGGIIVVAAGGVWLAQKLGVLIPDWVFTWEMLLIVIGFYIGARHLFRGFGWLIPVMIGAVFMIDNFIPGVSLKPFIWPALIIFIGLIMIFKPRKPRFRKHRWEHWDAAQHKWPNSTTTEDVIDSVSIFSGTKKNIISKNFKGGDVVCVFGGAEIDLSQADINGTVTLEATQCFGGTKLIVPANWHIIPEMVTILGGVEDKRAPLANAEHANKTLILRGTTVFGGIEITSH